MYKYYFGIIAFSLLITSCHHGTFPFSLIEKEKQMISNGNLNEMWLLLSDKNQQHFNDWVEDIKNPKKENHQKLTDLFNTTNCIQLNELNGKKFYTLLIKKSIAIIGKNVILNRNQYIRKNLGRTLRVYQSKNNKQKISTPMVFENNQWKFSTGKHKDDLIFLVLTDYNSMDEEEKENYFCDL